MTAERELVSTLGERVSPSLRACSKFYFRGNRTTTGSRERSLPTAYHLLRAHSRAARYSDTVMHSTPAFRWIFLNYVPDLRTTRFPIRRH